MTSKMGVIQNTNKYQNITNEHKEKPENLLSSREKLNNTFQKKSHHNTINSQNSKLSKKEEETNLPTIGNQTNISESTFN